MRSTVIFALIFFQTFLMFSQEQCAFTDVQQKYFDENPEIKKAHDELELSLLQKGAQKFLAEKKVSSNTVYEIPVVVHLMNDGTTPLKTEAEVIAWIEECNNYFGANNSLDANWLSEAEGGTVFPFKFVLAKRSPSCESTNGINQVDVTSTYPYYSEKGMNSDNSDGVTEAQLRELARWDPQVYYNIYVVNTFDSVALTQFGGLQGYAYFPSTPDARYGTFMKASVVRENNTTLPHEIGHALGLYHVFDGGTTSECPPVTEGGCAVDNDRVCDTPSSKNLLGVSSLPDNTQVNECDTEGWNNVQFNIMNYTKTDKLFTPGQRDRALAIFLATRENLSKSLGGTAPSETPPPTAMAPSCVPSDDVVNTGNFGFGMTLVEIGDIKNNSAASSLTSNANKVYYDYTASTCLTNAFSTDLIIANNPQSIKIQNGGPNNGIYSAWIDYNNDGVFTSNELIVKDKEILEDSEQTFVFNTPRSGAVMNTPLRLRVIGDAVASSDAPCGQREYGEVEDYNVTIKATASLSVNDFNTNLFISPNPASSIVKISNDRAISNIRVVNLAGQVIFEKKYNSNNIDLDLSNLAPSIYFLKITIEDSTVIKKILKN